MKKTASVLGAVLIVAATATITAAAYGDPVFDNPIYATQAGAGWFHVTDQTVDVWGDDGSGNPTVIGTRHNENVDVIQGPDQDWSGPAGIQPGYINYNNFLSTPEKATSGWGGAAAGGSLVVGFGQDFVNGDGNDFMVHGFGFSFNKAFSDERGTVDIYVADVSYNPTVSSVDPVTGLVTITGNESKWVKISEWSGRQADGSWIGNPNHNFESGVGAYCEYIWGDLEGSGLESARYIKIELGDGGHYDDPYTGEQNNGRALFIDAVEARGFEATANNAPVLDVIGNKSVDEEGKLGFTIQAIDPDGDNIEYTHTSDPAMAGATLGATSGVFSWTPAAGARGIYTVTFTATDDGSPAGSDEETIEITVGSVNHAPEFNANAPSATYAVLEGQSLEFTVSATDPDNGDTLTYTASGLPTGATFSGQVFSWAPGHDDAGEFTVVFTVTDDGTPEKSTSINVTITVGDVVENTSPHADAGADQVVDKGALVTLDGSGSSDPDAGDIIAYLWTQTSGTIVTLSKNTAEKPSFTALDPGDGESEVLTFTLTLSDSKLTDTDTVEITVNGDPVEVNHAPELKSIENKTVVEETELTFTLSATDPDEGDIITYFFTSNPDMPEATLDSASGLFSWIPASGEARTYTVTFTATDDASPSKTDQETIQISVAGIEKPAGPDQDVTEQTSVIVGVPESDNGEQTDTYLWEQISGPEVRLSDITAKAPSFVAPSVGNEDVVLTFRVTVNTEKTDEVRITVQDNGISEEATGWFSEAGVVFDNRIGADIIAQGHCYMGIDCEDGDLTFYEVQDPDDMENHNDKPGNLVYGVFNFSVSLAPGMDMATLTVYLPEPAPSDRKWYKYSDSLGWFDFSRDVISGGTGDGAVFNNDRTKVTLFITDGGKYDDDGVINGKVTDPSGLGTPRSSSDAGSDGGGGCFIGSTAQIGGLMGFLVSFAGAALGVIFYCRQR